MERDNDIPRWQAVSVHALITPIRTRPEPAVLLILHRFDKIFAHFVRCRLWIAMFAQYNSPQLFFIPFIHCIVFLVVLFSISCIRVQIFLSRFPLYAKVVTEFTLSSLLAVPFLIKYTE